MAKLIDKDALVAEIERRIEYNTEWKDACKTLAVLAANQAIEEDKKILSIINTLEVKEVDLEKEYEDFVVDDPIFGNFITNDTMGMNLAKHFFELGLKVAQKGEEV